MKLIRKLKTIALDILKGLHSLILLTFGVQLMIGIIILFLLSGCTKPNQIAPDYMYAKAAEDT
jgi:hypothetical protein